MTQKDPSVDQITPEQDGIKKSIIIEIASPASASENVTIEEDKLFSGGLSKAFDTLITYALDKALDSPKEQRTSEQLLQDVQDIITGAIITEIDKFFKPDEPQVKQMVAKIESISDVDISKSMKHDSRNESSIEKSKTTKKYGIR